MKSREAQGRSEYRTILIVDIEGFSAKHRDDAIRLQLRVTLRRLLAKALTKTGIEPAQYTMQTTGDGLLVTVDPTVSKPRILGPVIDSLFADLLEQDRISNPAERLRIRLVVHAADLLMDSDGPLGHQMNLAFRLLDAEELRRRLRRSSGPMLICVSDSVFRQVIAQRHEGLDPTTFERVWFVYRNGCELGWV